MANLLVSGLLGAAEGAGQAITKISDEERKKLADRLKMEAQAELQQAYQQRGFEQQEKMAGINAQTRSDLLEKESGLRMQETEKELGMRKEMGLLEPRPTVLSPGQVAVGPTGEKIAEGIKKADPGTAPKAADKIRAQKEAGDMLASLTKPKNKGGMGLEPGDEIPSIYLKRINAILESAGEPPVTQNIIPKVPGYWGRKIGRTYKEPEARVPQKQSEPEKTVQEQQTSDQKVKQFADKWGIQF